MRMFTRLQAKPHIPFIALADIAWQIIIFFLVASTFAKNNSLTVELPGSTNQATAQKAETITVQAGDNMLMINSQNVAAGDLEQNLRRMLAGKTSEQDRMVILMGRSDLTFQRNVDIMYAIQKAGGILVISEEK